MAGRIGSVQRAQDRACVYLGFSTLHEAYRASREALGLLVAALACDRRE